MMAKQPKGFILYRGPSVLDGQPIVAITTMKTSNAKTGDMVQVWILREDVSPVEAMKSGGDVSICGVCPQRRSIGGACYVNVGQGPRSVWEAYKRGVYSESWDPSTFKGRSVRLGAYGDPAAVPADILGAALECASGWTGYTHQLTHKNFQHEVLQWVMVSAETPKQAAAAQSKGYRTFRIKSADAPALAGEIECLSDAKGVQCVDCGLCAGKHAPTNVYINVHGSLSGRFDAKFGAASRRAL